MRHYRALIETGAAGNYGVVFPDFPGCVTVGDTIELALVNAAEVLLFHIEGMEEDGDQIPDPSPMGAPPPDWMNGIAGLWVLVPAETAGKVARINVTLDERLLARIDRVAGPRQRSHFLTEAAERALRERASA